MTLTSNPNDPDLHKVRQDGQNEKYLVLPQEARSTYRFPLRVSYVHQTCGTVTTIHKQIAETYAVNPGYYSHTFCVKCRSHFPVGEFVWEGTSIKVGTAG